jgi:hypothetical protein
LKSMSEEACQDMLVLVLPCLVHCAHELMNMWSDNYERLFQLVQWKMDHMNWICTFKFKYILQNKFKSDRRSIPPNQNADILHIP